MYENYKPTDTLSASGFMTGLPYGCGLVRNGVYIGMITKLLLVDTGGSLIFTPSLKLELELVFKQTVGVKWRLSMAIIERILLI